MKYASVNGNHKVEATPGTKGLCPHCGSEVIAKCGDLRVDHWAHKSILNCDPWLKEETDWHRAWKGRFPAEWQEVRQQAKDGEWHIADVKTDQEWVIEFQHSPIKPDERRSRDTFYQPKLIWIVDGMRRKRDEVQLTRAWTEGGILHEKLPFMRSVFSHESALLRDWADSMVPVFFDFGDVNKPLWCLIPGCFGGKLFIGPLSYANFMDFHKPGAGQGFENLFKHLAEIMALLREQAQVRRSPAPNSVPLWRARGFRTRPSRRL